LLALECLIDFSRRIVCVIVSVPQNKLALTIGNATWLESTFPSFYKLCVCSPGSFLGMGAIYFQIETEETSLTQHC